jgi:hypothetical protein
MGIWVTGIMALIFGSINPWGALIPQIWITQVLGWLYISIAGGIMGRRGPQNNRQVWGRTEVGFVAGIVTLFFDLFTNLGYAWAFNVSYWLTLASGLGFMVLHVVTNVIIFASVVPSLVLTVHSQLRDTIWQSDIDTRMIESEE